jgi:hypothetical protein
MDATDNTGKARTPKQATASSVATDRPFGPDGATILATEHWSLLGTRSLIWNEAMSRTTVFLTVLSAAIVALALLADATGFGRRTTAVALVLLPVVFLLGLATYGRLVQINSEDVAITLAMNRLRYAYLVMAPTLGPTSAPATTTTSGGSPRPTCWAWGAFCRHGRISWSPRRPSWRPWRPPSRPPSSCWRGWPSRPRPAPSWPPEWSHSWPSGERCSPYND